jgi:hypothetical protein
METIAEALERFNEYMRAEFLEWHIDFLKRRMEKMDIEGEAQDLKVAEARSTCEECKQYGHVHGKPQFNASSSIQYLVPLCTQLKDSMEDQAKINKWDNLSGTRWVTKENFHPKVPRRRRLLKLIRERRRITLRRPRRSQPKDQSLRRL